MKQQQQYLGDFFAKARSETPIVSGEEIDALLDRADLHGRQTLPREEVSHPTPSYSTTNKRRIVMGSIAAVFLGAIVGAGAWFFNPGTPQYISQGPIIAGTIAPKGNHTTPQNGENQLQGVEKSNPAPTAIIPALEAPVNGKGEDGKQTPETPVVPKGDKEEKGKSDIGEQLSKELQGFVENYWVNKINEYKSRIDGMLSPGDRDELNRLRVRWALVDKEDSPLNFMANMNMKSVSPNGEETQVETSLGNAENAPSVETTDGKGHGVVTLSFGAKSENVNETVTDDEKGHTVTRQQSMVIVNNNHAIVSADAQNGSKAKTETKTVMIATNSDDTPSDLTAADVKGDGESMMIAIHEDDNAELPADGKKNRTLIVTKIRKQEGSETKELSGSDTSHMTIINIPSDPSTNDEDGRKMMITIDKNEVSTDTEGNKIVIAHKTDADSEADFDMGPMMGMMKMAISSDQSEPSRILVATWDLADAHRPQLDELKATITSDLATFMQEIHQKMTAFVAEHGDEIPAEMRELLTKKLDDKDVSGTLGVMKSLEPMYNILVEPMILLYNGSDINGMLTSAITEPVAGVSLEANATLKQSYPNPASTEATIEYTLQGPSTSTLLRLFDAKGGEVKHLDLGAQSSGSHNTTIDVSELPAGTYLYHLTLGTAQGEKVFSKTMQVTR